MVPMVVLSHAHRHHQDQVRTSDEALLHAAGSSYQASREPTTVMRAIHEDRLFAVRVSERVYRIPVGALASFERGLPERITVPAVGVTSLSEPAPAELVTDPAIAAPM